ncbi:competence/damage-inducible protein CinA [Rhodotorula diobovata]|uniref:Competence/damage-inducible protein CinA n=1 Tax=Rhodotorula diobovata TaxID=5288 RepID=A0A5C5FKI2_9BASI|nr:competence/damage-inducible protein CinA [Rhodotorula diobovata]
MSLPLPRQGPTAAPLSGSNRLPVSPRRSASQLPPPPLLPSLGSTTMGAGTLSSTYQRPFPVPPYLRHASLFANRFETVPSVADDDSALALDRPPSQDKGKARASAPFLGVDPVPSSSGGVKPSRSRDQAHEPPILLPTCWDESDRCALLELTSDGLGVSFAGSAKYGDRDAAAVRANRPVPPQAGVYYYEVQVLDKGVSGYIGIGLSDRSVPLGRLPGWEDKSYGYHADDGRAFCSQGNGEEFGPTFTTMDTVGCGIDWTGAGPPRGDKERSPRVSGAGRGAAHKDRADADKGGGRVFFTKNGEFLGYAFCGLQGKLYPTVGLRTPNEAVRVNFGAAPFRFDIEGLVLERKRAVLARLNSTDPSPSSFLPSPAPPIPALLPTSPHERTHETLQALISAYLVHHGYTATAAAFGAQVRAERVERATGLGPRRGAASSAGARDGTTGDGDGHEDGPDALLVSAAEASAVRADIRAAALEGRADDALVLLEAHYPSALAPSAPGGGQDTDPSGGILFRLRCRAFVEAALALSRSGAGAGPGDGLDALLARGQALHAAYGADPRPAVRDELQAVLGLVAYGDPEREATGRTRELLGERERDKVADEVNAAVLRAANLPPVPALEALYRQACATVRLAGDVGCGAAALVDVPGEVLAVGRLHRR